MMDCVAVAENFIFAKEARATVPHDTFDLDIPVVDLSPVLALHELREDTAGETEARKMEIRECEESKLPAILQNIRWACEKFGIFQSVNHGCPMEYIQQITDKGQRFFAKPEEEKQKVRCEVRGNNIGYFSKRHPYSGEVADRWMEGLTLPLHPDEQLTDVFAALMWPDSLELSNATSELCKQQGLKFKALSRTILELMAQSLGVSDTSYYTKGSTILASGIRLNRYPKCPRPDLTFGHPAHTDPSLITVLHQDAVGGLQILSDEGKWLGVKPHPGAIVIHVGDLLQAWTNDRFKSVIHRAVTNSEQERLSIVFFEYPARDVVVAVPPELVDSEHPAVYRTFTCDDFVKAMYSLKFRKERTLQLLRSFRTSQSSTNVM